MTHSQVTSRPRSPQHRDSASSAGSDHGEDCSDDIEFSEDEGLMPDSPAYTGLFRPALFKSLLHKARLTTNHGAGNEQPSTSQAEVGPHDALFKVANRRKTSSRVPSYFWMYFKCHGINLGH